MYMIAEVSQYVAVASFAEAWIEIPSMALSEKQKFVASFAEAWIEIVPSAFFVWLFGSPPSRRRGLKYSCENIGMQAVKASPPSRRRGLKSPVISLTSLRFYGRLLRGGVD